VLIRSKPPVLDNTKGVVVKTWSVVLDMVLQAPELYFRHTGECRYPEIVKRMDSG